MRDIPRGASVTVVHRRRRLASFLPTDVSGLDLWVQADAITGLSDGDAVATWSDLSGNSNDLSGEGGAKNPTYKVNIQNGLSIVRFDGADDSAESSFALEQPVNIFLVFTQQTWTANDRIFDGGPSQQDKMAFYQTGVSPNVAMWAGAGGSQDNTMTLTTFFLCETLWSGAASYIRVNGGTATVANAGTSDPAGITLGAGAAATPNNWGNIDVGEVLIYSTTPSATERGLIETYLNNRWALY